MAEVSRARQEMIEERVEITNRHDDLQAKHDAIEETLADLENDNLHKAKEVSQRYGKY